MSTTADTSQPPAAPEALEAAARPRQKSLTIGAVCKALKQEFPDATFINKVDFRMSHD